jgi:hypothetical protein
MRTMVFPSRKKISIAYIVVEVQLSHTTCDQGDRILQASITVSATFGHQAWGMGSPNSQFFRGLGTSPWDIVCQGGRRHDQGQSRDTPNCRIAASSNVRFLDIY